MKMNLDLYYVFYTVANSGSISAAVNHLFISQPAISFQIKKLEDELGVTLFIRTKKGVSLTNEGKILYDYLKVAFDSIRNGENTLTNLKNLDSGVIRIGASTTVSRFVLMPYLEIFHDKYPNIDIQIVNNLTENLLKELKSGNLDMLILNLPMDEEKNLKIIKVKEVQDIFVCNKKFFELTNGSIDLKDLNNYPLLFQKAPSNTRAFLDNYLKKNNIVLKPKLEVVSYNLIMDLVKSGFGVGYATREFLNDELGKSLFEVKIFPEVPKRYIGIALVEKNTPNYSVKKLINIMTKEKN